MKHLPKIVPIIQPVIDWNNFVTIIDSLTDQSPTRLLDSSGRMVGDYASFIGALGYHHNKQSPDNALKNSEYLLNHLNFSFLIEIISLRDYYLILTETELKCINDEENKVIIASGTLLQWKNACLSLTNKINSFALRYSFDAIFLYFNSIGLGEIFHGIKKNGLSDQTFMLEDKR